MRLITLVAMLLLTGCGGKYAAIKPYVSVPHSCDEIVAEMYALADAIDRKGRINVAGDVLTTGSQVGVMTGYISGAYVAAPYVLGQISASTGYEYRRMDYLALAALVHRCDVPDIVP